VTVIQVKYYSVDRIMGMKLGGHVAGMGKKGKRSRAKVVKHETNQPTN